jgi:hypothetical protein
VIKMISESFDFLTFGIWESICQRLLLSVSPTLSGKRFRVPETERKTEDQARRRNELRDLRK